MLDEAAYERAMEKIQKAEFLADNEGLDWVEVSKNFYELFKRVFNEIIEDELTYDEILAFAEKHLESVYIEFSESVDEMKEILD